MAPNPSLVSTPVRPAPTGEAAEAFASLAAEIKAVTPGEISMINFDIPRVVSIVLGAAPEMLKFRAEIVDLLPRHPIEKLDKLKIYALGAWYAHLVAMPPARGDDEFKELLAMAQPLRRSLLVAAEALADRGLLDATRVEEIRSGQGNLDTANDLVALAALFTTSRESIQGKTAVEEEELARASRIGTELIVALGERDKIIKAARSSDAADTRARAATLLLGAYSACRQAVAYVRWGLGDADDIAPSPFTGRGGRPRAESGPETSPTIAPAAKD
jgi:hypothetical protein